MSEAPNGTQLAGPASQVSIQGIGTSPVSAAATHVGPDETVKMNKYHLLWVIRRLRDRQRGPSFEQVLIPATLGLGLLVALLPAEFQDYANVEAAVWEALIILSTGCALLVAAFLFVWWSACRINSPPKTEEEIYEEIITEMEKDRKRLTEIESRIS
jgi:hypothetical protein